MHKNKHRDSKMERERNNSQMKQKVESLEKELNEIEASNLSDRVQNNGYKEAQGM